MAQESGVPRMPRSLPWLWSDNGNQVCGCMKTPDKVSLRSRIQPWLLHVRMRPALLVVSALILLALVVGFSGHEVGRHIKSIEPWITQLGLPGVLVFIGLVVVGTSLLLPESLFGAAAGVLFGLAWGVVIILLARILAAVLQYGLAHGLLREPIRRRLRAGKMSSAIRYVASSGSLRLQLLLRLAPLNQATISYLLAASGVRFPHFFAASMAMLPSIFVEVYLGRAGKHLALISAGVAHSGWRHNLFLFAGLLVVAIGVGFVSWAAYRRVLRETKASK